MASRMPPVPPAGRSGKGDDKARAKDETAPDTTAPGEDRPENLAEQGRQGNVKQNTTNKGYQQER